MNKLERWLTIVTNLGVMIGLLLVAYQVQQTNTVIRQDSLDMQLDVYAAGPEIMGDFFMRIVENPELSALWFQGNAGEEFTSDDLARYQMLVDEYLIRWGQMFAMFDSQTKGRGGFVIQRVVQDLQRYPGLLREYRRYVEDQQCRNRTDLHRVPSDALVSSDGFWDLLDAEARAQSLIDVTQPTWRERGLPASC